MDEDTVARILTPAIARDLMRATLMSAARGTSHGPVRNVIALEAGWFGTMPATIAVGGLGGLGAKLVTAFPANGAAGLPSHHAAIVLFAPDTGAPLAVVAGETITERRTAAVSVVATEKLATRPRGRLAVLGCGVQGRAHLHAFLDAGFPSSIALWSRTRAHAEALACEAADAGVALEIVHRVSDAVSGADVVVTATAATDPLFAAHEVADGAHVNAVGACAASRRELPAALMAEGAIYVDSAEAARIEAGDLLLAERELGTPLAIAGELGAVLAGQKARDRAHRVSIFKSLGIGIEDVACAAYVLHALAVER
ncbi:MAG: ornithine cyclodeaminase family protein [Candidatus Eremiobacteraeota bacterium]|nr:ornithine cyclodeaminase family protein [Candidatus Eremiobacteraeota bacterium]